jgi:hypothetical protein
VEKSLQLPGDVDVNWDEGKGTERFERRYRFRDKEDNAAETTLVYIEIKVATAFTLE